ncbi:HAD family hydrolase [Vulcanococcus limneticus]|uniref:HAD family hydrolase n=1 Tax=Vulcanococcus limneticus TaxID=2170428 RepID=UPI00398BFE62
MHLSPLLVFDFDGVLVDGMAEYWWSARRAALALRPQLCLPEQAPAGFRLLRPQIHKGWEMVLCALELSRSDLDLAAFLAEYNGHTEAALERWQLNAAQLQGSLEAVRHAALRDDRDGWLALHRPYPGVPERLRRLETEGSPWLVLTTKGEAFARELLAAAGLKPLAVYGHERGSKPEVLLQLSREQPLGQGARGAEAPPARGALRPLWFIEDRRPTLERVRATDGLAGVRCFLVSWGYLGPGDRHELPPGIQLLEPQQFAAPLARWP